MKVRLPTLARARFPVHWKCPTESRCAGVRHEGILVMDLFQGKMAWERFDGTVHRFLDLPEDEIYPMYAPAKNLVDVVAGDASNLSPATLGATAMKIIEAACLSARTGESIRIEGWKITGSAKS